MAQSKGNKRKGFGSMDEARKREAASRGGQASAQSDTSNRGFASMDKDKQRDISVRGGRLSHENSGKHQGSSGVKREDEDLKDLSSTTESDTQGNFILLKEDRSRPAGRMADMDASETDEDEDEGLGDGKIGRSASDELGK